VAAVDAGSAPHGREPVEAPLRPTMGGGVGDVTDGVDSA